MHLSGAFCYAVAECQVAGAYPITPNIGSLGTTNMGTLLAGEASNPHWVKSFADEVIRTLKNKELPAMQDSVREKAIDRFSLTKIMKEWDKLFYD